MRKNVYMVLFGFSIGLLLWFSGVDAQIQWALNNSYHHGWNQFWRLVSIFGLGRVQMAIAITMACYLAWKTLPRASRPAFWQLPFWLSFGAIIACLKLCIGNVNPFPSSSKTKPYQPQDDLIQNALNVCAALPNKAKGWLYVVPVIFASGVVAIIFKIIFGRPRPKMMLWHDGLYDATWFNLSAKFHSFPSGHTTSTFAFLAVLIALYPRYKVFLCGVAVLLAVSRVAAVTPHFTGDVVAGAALGYAIGAALVKIYKIKS